MRNSAGIIISNHEAECSGIAGGAVVRGGAAVYVQSMRELLQRTAGVCVGQSGGDRAHQRNIWGFHGEKWWRNIAGGSAGDFL